ncbi:hypothetical protein STEG23_004451 [Scotinomys teguina]
MRDCGALGLEVATRREGGGPELEKALDWQNLWQFSAEREANCQIVLAVSTSQDLVPRGSLPGTWISGPNTDQKNAEVSEKRKLVDLCSLTLAEKGHKFSHQ